MSVRLVLDTTALLAYVSGDTRAVEVGELIAVVAEDGDVTGIPALCLIAVHRQVDAEQRAKLRELTGDDGPTVILPMSAADIGPVAELAEHLPFELAQAASAADQHDSLLATYDRSAYATTVDPDEILDL